MKHICTIYLIFGSLFATQGQIVPNGGFEDWDTSDTLVLYPYPLEWGWFHIVNANCMVPVNMTMEPSEQSSSGCCSVKLTTQYCRRGVVYSGNVQGTMPLAEAFECMARPAQMSFQHMFVPVGADSAFVYIRLFNYDSITPGLSYSERFDQVGLGRAYFHEEVTSFTPFIVPIEYYTEDIPAFMQIRFMSSGSQTNVSSGTSLWIDDIQLDGTVDIQDEVRNQPISIFPNPAGDHIWFKDPSITGEVQVLIFDAKGAQVLDQRITNVDRGMDVSHLRPGLYSIVLKSREGVALRTSWVKE